MAFLRKRKGYWVIEFRLNGRRRSISPGLKCLARNGKEINRNKAEDELAEINLAIRKGEFNPDTWYVKSNASYTVELTLNSFADEFLGTVSKQTQRYSQNTINNYAYGFEKLWEVFPGHMRISQLDNARVSKDFLPWLYEHYAWNTARGILISLRAAFNHAQVWGYISSNPFAGVNTRRRKKIPEFYSAEDIEVMRSYFGQPAIPAWQGDIVFFDLNTGLRKEELLTIRHPDYKQDINCLVFAGKGQKERMVPLNQAAQSILEKRPRNSQDDRIFWEASKHGFESAFKRMKARTGLGGNIHQLRRTYASRFVMEGGDLLRLKENLGHQDLDTVLIYATLSPAARREGVISSINL